MNDYEVECLGCRVEVRARDPEQAMAEGLAKLRRQGVAIPAKFQKQATVRQLHEAR